MFFKAGTQKHEHVGNTMMNEIKKDKAVVEKRQIVYT
jgi:hypothetical protein